MKITVDFFNLAVRLKKHMKRGINYFSYILIIMIIALLITVIGKFALNNKYVSNNILYMASNIRQAEITDINKEDVMIMANNIESPFTKKQSKVRNEIKDGFNVKSVDKAQRELDEFDVSLVDTTEVINKNSKDNLYMKETDQLQRINVYDMTILNYSSKRDIDILSLFKKNIILTKKSDPVLIYTTHTSESYTNSQRYKFDYSSTYRSRDAKYNMLSVGKILLEALQEKSMKVIFDTTPHDYGSYEIAYTNSRKTIENALTNNDRIGLAIDVHRDALGDLTNGPTVEVNGQKVAKIMFVIGVGTNTYVNKYWEDNLALALQLQKLGEEMYPGLFRAMIIRNSKYNQDLIKHSFLIEVGTTGNTLEEAYFGARCLANILNKFYNN